MVTVHHLNNSRSQRVLWLLEELEVPYEIKRYNRDPKTMLAPPELKAIHPLGKSPVISDDGNVVAESGAIVEYLLNKYGQGRLKPKSDADQLRMTYWLHYAEGSAMPPLLLSLIFSRLPKQPIPFFIKPVVSALSSKVLSTYVNPQIETHLSFMELELSKSEWFAGSEFTAADIQMSFPLEAAEARAGLDRYPKLKSFLSKIHSRPAYKRALEKGGAYELLM